MSQLLPEGVNFPVCLRVLMEYHFQIFEMNDTLDHISRKISQGILTYCVSASLKAKIILRRDLLQSSIRF